MGAAALDTMAFRVALANAGAFVVAALVLSGLFSLVARERRTLLATFGDGGLQGLAA